MATDRDEQQRQQRELEEIRRSFAEMGARMGSMFEPSELEKLESPRPQAPPPATGDRTPLALQGRPRWWWAGALALLFLAGTGFGWLLPGGGDGDDTTAPTQTTTASPPEPSIVTPPPEPSISVPEVCLDTAEKADEVIARLTANIRDNRLAAELRDYTISAQACRREAQP
jgi:hypothetical protein